MKKDNVIQIETQEIKDPITEILQSGARKLLSEALEAEINGFLNEYKEFKDASGHQRIVRNGYLPERDILTGIGPVEVKVPRVRDREPNPEPVRFHSGLLPRYLRKTRDMEELIPWLYLKGISTGDFKEALSAILGVDTRGLSASVISRLKDKWQKEYGDWRKRDLSQKQYVYFWVDGIYFSVRCEESKHCMLVIIGATEDGRKELVAVEDGFRESEQSWKRVLLLLKTRGLSFSPKLAVGDGALGFWKALAQVFPDTRTQRCWMHKSGNVIDCFPKSEQPAAKQLLQDIWMAATKENAEKAFHHFIETYKAKYPKATDTLAKDKDELLAFYDFPAEHWTHIRTTNPIESTFATVRLRTYKTKVCLQETCLQ